MTSNLIFALDIGTRSIVGLVMQETHKGLEIIAFDHLEHQNRAMVDGQIHDIEEVAKGIKIVKEKIETKIGQTLNQVAVAAAGRALRTVRLKVNNDLGDYKEIHRDDILRLELQAVQEAQGKLAVTEKLEAEESLNYHCVGYSVVNYELDGFKIGNLYSQKGKNMGVEIIATFLPRVVVDSLFAALNRVDLEMISLTLEPIAASAVVVPPSMRQLNIALVDIGAGTSDIAITDDGSIVGYGMVPVAGDEITEKISQQYLVDFYQAENIKKSLLNLEEITFSDVLGIEHTFSKKEILDSILTLSSL
jgi:cell division protein FtsA